jgi:hypothetical protein
MSERDGAPDLKVALKSCISALFFGQKWVLFYSKYVFILFKKPEILKHYALWPQNMPDHCQVSDGHLEIRSEQLSNVSTC